MKLALALLCISLSFLPARSDWLRNHVFAVTDQAPIAKALNGSAPGRASLQWLLAYYKKVEQKMSASPPEDDMDSVMIPHTIRYRGLPPLAGNKQGLYLPFGHDDVKLLKADEDLHRSDLRDFRRDESSFFKNVITFNEAVERTGAAVNASTLLGWRLYAHYALVVYRSVTGADNCQVYVNIAYRVRGRWGVGATLTNDLRTVHKREGERRYLTECVGVDERTGDVRPALHWFDLSYGPLATRYWNGAGVRAGPGRLHDTRITHAANRTRVTSFMSVWGGRPGISHFGATEMEDVAAFNIALASGKYLKRQARDSKSTANAAILLVPALLTFVPLALFVDCSDARTLLFALVTDVFAILPLLIKGAELLIAGFAEHSSARTLVYGTPAAEGTIVAETWAAKCTADRNLHVYGAAFVSIAVGAMIIGIFLEVYVKVIVKRNARAMYKLRAENAAITLWEKGGPCVECLCEDDDCGYSAESSDTSSGLLGQLRQRRHDARFSDPH